MLRLMGFPFGGNFNLGNGIRNNSNPCDSVCYTETRNGISV